MASKPGGGGGGFGDIKYHVKRYAKYVKGTKLFDIGIFSIVKPIQDLYLRKQKIGL